ncbi:hypothetical protein GCM10010449_18410 [Streptomyces rectiviolaceus]|uniref:DUF309 domain-containing protein n=1 Tax=Streptomyces rectiviolaceus TaxID=332591 RepID=A0ABP6MAQ8_9ACTN
MPYGTEGVERQPEGVTRTPEETVAQAQALLDAGRPFHAHEVFEDAWKSGPDGERDLWKGLAQLAVGLTHSARGNVTGGARLLLRGAGAIGTGQWGERPYGIDVDGLVVWARQLAETLEAESLEGESVEGDGPTVDAAEHAPRLRGAGRGDGGGRG